MSLVSRIKQKVNFNDPQQVKKAVGSLFFYFDNHPKEQKVYLAACEYIFEQVKNNKDQMWKLVLIYTSGVLYKMRKSLK